MFYERKTKDRNIIKNFSIPIIVLPLFALIWRLFGVALAFYSLGGVYVLLSVMPFITFLRTRNSGFLAVTMFMAFAGLVSISAPPIINDKSDLGMVPILLVGMYASMMVTAYLTLNRKLKWRGQEIFELAAMSVEDTGNSFTSRPRPTGQISISKTEMIRFIDFITTNLIAFAFREENRIVFVLGLPGNDTSYILGLKKDYNKDTWVAIDYDGKVTVNITQEDYLLFKQDLDFDQLCQSVGNVFIEFLNLSRDGKESQIIDRMNALRLHPFA